MTSRVGLAAATAAPPAPVALPDGGAAPGPPPSPPPAPGPSAALGGRLPVALLVRLAACVALAVFGAQAWGTMVRPADPWPLIGAALLGGALGLGALAAAPLRRALRGLALGGLALVGLAAALVLAGVPADLLGPRVWDDLTAGLGDGISALPGLSVPYRGIDEWNRIALLLGGTLLAVAGPLVACWPGRRGRVAPPIVPAVLLSVLYAVPAVQLRLDHPYLEGAAFALLLAAVLFADRLRRREVPAALVAVSVAAVLAVAVAPRLDGVEPWVDYESFAQSLGERGTTAFSWDHRYGPLDWPRDGREVLRIRAATGAYWKATTLADFDGARWREVRPQGIEDDPASEQPREEWIAEQRVSVRNLRTSQFIAAGTALSISRSPRKVVDGAPGSYAVSGRPLRRGHAYVARSYVPRPRGRQLQTAGTGYPTTMWPYLTMQLPRSVGGPVPIDPETMRADPAQRRPGFVVFSAFGDERPALGYNGRGYGERAGEQWIEASAYARTYRLAQRLLAQSATPHEYVRRVQAHFRNGFTYTETPPERRVPLDAFLFRDKAGYCQQFSGAMTLLLRMGGVPARVASGFSPGTFDITRREFVVRDVDAHSWVEAYFPGLGWMTFDPTPPIAPARSQNPGAVDDPDAAADAAAADDEADTSGGGGDRASDAAAGGEDPAAAPGDGAPIGLIVLGALLVGGAVGVGVLAFRARRRRAALGPDAAVAELERALRRSGRVPAGGLTLARLEERLRTAPDAASYVRAVRTARFGFGGSPPTHGQRRALRRELSAGLGLRGRLRSLWALPPW